VIVADGQQYNISRVWAFYGPHARSAKLALMTTSGMGPTHDFPAF
jgi:hypothetical protein